MKFFDDKFIMAQGKTLNSLPANAIPSKSFNSNVNGVAANQQKYMQPKTVGQQPVNQNAYQQSSQQAVQPKPVQPKPVQQAPAKPIPSATATARDAADAASSFINAMQAMVKGFSLLNDDVIEKNFKMAIGEGMSNEDRTISFECIDYLMSNFAHIIMGLVLDINFKNAFKEAVMIEIQLDSESPEMVAKKRAAMKDNHDYASSGSIVIGVTSFNAAIEKDLMDKMQHSFDVLDPFASEFDEEVANMSDQRKIEYGFIFSNFMYLIRAFSHNDLFMSYVVTVVEKVKESLGVKV